MPHYTPSKQQLSDPRTLQKLTETLHSTYIYRNNAREFCRVRHTYSYTLMIQFTYILGLLLRINMCVCLCVLAYLICTTHIYTVSRHLFCWVVQPHAAHVCFEAHTLFLAHNQHEDSSSSLRLGMEDVWHVHVYAHLYVHCNGCMYALCLLLLYLSQNENANRAYTSTHRVADLRRPDRCTAMKVPVDKTYNFVDAPWEAYMKHNNNDLR